MSEPTRAEHCVIACAEAWRGDGEVLASPFGWIPTIGARLAKATFEPDLVITDGETMALANTVPVGPGDHEQVIEAWLPFRFIFDLLSAGRRHVMMGAVQIDRHGNQNISCIGEHATPAVQLIGARGGPGNTINHATSYWIPGHSKRAFVEAVDFVSGVGADRGGHVRYVITNLGVFDFEDGAMRVRSLHPGVTAGEVVESTAFELPIPDDVPLTRNPTDEELHLVREVLDPGNLRDTEIL